MGGAGQGTVIDVILHLQGMVVGMLQREWGGVRAVGFTSGWVGGWAGAGEQGGGGGRAADAGGVVEACKRRHKLGGTGTWLQTTRGANLPRTRDAAVAADTPN